MRKKKVRYPYQNKTLGILPGERWKDIKGFEGYYQASNLGRVKSLDRIVPHPRIGSQFVLGRILTQSVHENGNLKTGTPMIYLQVSLSREGQMFYLNTRRIIYATFVKPINYEKDGKYVINIDNDGYNNRVSNLKLVTKSEKSQRIILRKRHDSFLKYADRSLWPKTYGGYSRRKPVKQYDQKGKLIAKYESIAEASRQTGCGEKEIIYVAKGIYGQTGGFKWKYVG
jgi:hypothetical protein